MRAAQGKRLRGRETATTQHGHNEEKMIFKGEVLLGSESGASLEPE